MGKEIYVNNELFRIYFGKCFDGILLGDRLYGLKQETSKKTEKALHTFVRTSTEYDPTTKKSNRVNKIVGYYDDKEVDVKTGKLTDEQKLMLKQSFLQLAYDAVSNKPTQTKKYTDLTYNPTIEGTLPIESYYKSVMSSGNVNVELDYNKKEKDEWEKIQEEKNPNSAYTLKLETMEMYYENDNKISEYSSDYREFLPNFKYRANLATFMVNSLASIKGVVYSQDKIAGIDDYFDNLYEAVLENMEPEDRKIIEKEFPNFGVTSEEKELFLSRCQDLEQHFISIDPVLAGNKYVESVYPDAKKNFVSHSTEILNKYFSKTINEKDYEKAKENYNEEIGEFAKMLLNQSYDDPIDIRRVRTAFGLNRLSIKTEKEANAFIDKVKNQIMPALVVSQEYGITSFDKNPKLEHVVSVNLNKLIANKEVPENLSKVAFEQQGEKYRDYTAIYDTYVKPSLKENGTLDLKKMQTVWLDLSKQMIEPIGPNDNKALKYIKNQKEKYKELEEFNGEKKNLGEDFKAFETKIEWRNDAVFNIIKDSIYLYAGSNLKNQIQNSYRFGMSSTEYGKLMRKSMRGREVAADALNRIKSLDEKPTEHGKSNPYKYVDKDEQGFIKVPNDPEAKQDYLRRCCIEMNTLQNSYDNRSFWYHIAFWRTKYEKEAINSIKESLLRNGYSNDEIKSTMDSIIDKTNTDGAFNYKYNHHFQEEENIENDKDVIDIGVEKEASDMEFKELKELTSQILPKKGIKIIDPLLGNVSEMYGVVYNGEKNSIQESFILEQIAKDKLEEYKENPPKVITEKDVEIWENPSEMDTEIDKDVEEYFKVDDDFDPNKSYDEEELEENNAEKDEQEELKESLKEDSSINKNVEKPEIKERYKSNLNVEKEKAEMNNLWTDLANDTTDKNKADKTKEVSNEDSKVIEKNIKK